MHIHVLQHVSFEGPAYIAQWAQERGHTMGFTRFFQSAHLPGIDQLDWLLIMGGPMSVHDTREYPWLAEEKQFIGEAIRAGKTVVGICLGAQLIADVLGAKVSIGLHKEIGWYAVHRTAGSADTPLADALPVSMDVFHWHGETFGIPDGAVRLYASSACANQGFVLGDRIIGLQFHLEATSESIGLMLQYGHDELAKDTYVQTAAEIVSANGNIEAANAALCGLLDALPALVLPSS